jgi:hypothetical protein
MRAEGWGTDYRRARLPVIGDGGGGGGRLDARYRLSALLHETLWRELGRIAVDEPTCGSGRVGRPRVKPGVNFTLHGVLPPRSACKCDAGEKASMAARIAPGAAQWARSGQARGRLHVAWGLASAFPRNVRRNSVCEAGGPAVGRMEWDGEHAAGPRWSETDGRGS